MACLDALLSWSARVLSDPGPRGLILCRLVDEINPVFTVYDALCMEAAVTALYMVNLDCQYGLPTVCLSVDSLNIFLSSSFDLFRFASLPDMPFFDSINLFTTTPALSVPISPQVIDDAAFRCRCLDSRPYMKNNRSEKKIRCIRIRNGSLPLFHGSPLLLYKRPRRKEHVNKNTAGKSQQQKDRRQPDKPRSSPLLEFS